MKSFPPSTTKLLQIAIYGGGGNRTRVRGRTEQNVYERSPRFISPAGRFTDDLPTGQPS
jgi:hypothetical protein